MDCGQLIGGDASVFGRVDVWPEILLLEGQQPNRGPVLDDLAQVADVGYGTRVFEARVATLANQFEAWRAREPADRGLGRAGRQTGNNRALRAVQVDRSRRLEAENWLAERACRDARVEARQMRPFQVGERAWRLSQRDRTHD